jgi:hypothetical protein
MVKRPRAASDAHEARTPQKRPRMDDGNGAHFASPSQGQTAWKTVSQKRVARPSVVAPMTPRSENGARMVLGPTPEEVERQERLFELENSGKMLARIEAQTQRRETGIQGVRFSLIPSENH